MNEKSVEWARSLGGAMPRLVLSLLLSLLIASSASALTMDWTPIGNPGNACDPQPVIFPEFEGCHGSVGYVYNIGTYEVTNAQYAEFLNAKAASDPLELYNTNMRDPSQGGTGCCRRGGITRSGISGSYTYSPIAGRENMPVNYVSFFDASRFANWVNNGQGSGDTETGAYTLLGGTPTPSNGATVMRNGGAAVFLASEDEWYKAAYYSPSTASYFDYPTGTDTPTACAAPTAVANSANCDAGTSFPNDNSTDADVDDLTNVGSFSGSPSPYGAFDQAGNVWEWTETILPIHFNGSRFIRGGSWDDIAVALEPSSWEAGSPANSGTSLGFRLVMLPVRSIDVPIDIKPGSDTNPINPRGRGVVPVAILGSDTFDVDNVDVTKLAFGPDGAASTRMRRGDANHDDVVDLISYYRMQETGIAFGDTEACVTGKLFDGTPFEGCDSIETVGSGGPADD